MSVNASKPKSITTDDAKNNIRLLWYTFDDTHVLRWKCITSLCTPFSLAVKWRTSYTEITLPSMWWYSAGDISTSLISWTEMVCSSLDLSSNQWFIHKFQLISAFLFQSLTVRCINYLAMFWRVISLKNLTGDWFTVTVIVKKSSSVSSSVTLCMMTDLSHPQGSNPVSSSCTDRWHTALFHVLWRPHTVGGVVPPGEVMAHLQYIMADDRPPQEFPVGAFTSEKRDVWARYRKKLIEAGTVYCIQHSQSCHLKNIAKLVLLIVTLRLWSELCEKRGFVTVG